MVEIINVEIDGSFAYLEGIGYVFPLGVSQQQDKDFFFPEA